LAESALQDAERTPKCRELSSPKCRETNQVLRMAAVK
jgi:hypothetical protein